MNLHDVDAIGIAYQMHGLVIVDDNLKPIRPSIIWCDSRAVDIGNGAFKRLGEERCLENLLNSPGNFTASKLKWVLDNEEFNYRKTYKMMLPGDYIAMMLTGEPRTTTSGLSEGILWDFKREALADFVLSHYGIALDKIADVVPTFGIQGTATRKAADELGLKEGTPVSYRAGDQPNNAFSLNVLNPGEVATTAGTSGVIYGVTDKANYDPESRVNIFVHVNHSHDTPRYGVLMCINGAGSLNRWLKHRLLTGKNFSYEDMNEMADSAPVGSEGVLVLPFGNGAERTLINRNIGASIHGLDFNTHNIGHILRAAQEGVVFAFKYGLDIMDGMGLTVTKARAGNANMFLSPIFKLAFANTMNATLELYDTDGAQGAARGAGVGVGIFNSPGDAFKGLEKTETIEPDETLTEIYSATYARWLRILNSRLAQRSN